MQYTDHYNLNLPEGTDIVNPLVQDNPNYTAIDGALYANKLRVVGNATEVKSGTAHAITRSDSDIDVFRFTATGDWITGDTMTVDGTPVSVFLPDGSSPLTGAYIINSEVIAVVNGSRVTLYGSQHFSADDIRYNNALSGLSATTTQGAIDEVNAKIDKGYVSVTADGVKTYSQLFADLSALIDGSKIRALTSLQIGSTVFKIASGLPVYTFTYTGTSSAAVVTQGVDLTNKTYYRGVQTAGGLTMYDQSSNIPSSGLVLTVTY